MAALIPDESCFVLASFIFFLGYENGTGHIWDQCCHLQGDGASLDKSDFRQLFHLRTFYPFNGLEKL